MAALAALRVETDRHATLATQFGDAFDERPASHWLIIGQ